MTAVLEALQKGGTSTSAPDVAPAQTDLQQGMQAVPQEAPPPQTGLNRIQALANKVVVCEVCSNTVLFEINLRQYRPGYSASAGGDVQPLDDCTQVVLMCPCGNVITPNIGGVRGGRTPNVILTTLLEGLRKAKAARAELAGAVEQLATTILASNTEFEELKAGLVAPAAPEIEGEPLVAASSMYDELVARVTALEQTLVEMSSKVVAQPVAEATKPAEKVKGQGRWPKKDTSLVQPGQVQGSVVPEATE
jgi:hypothetical protein